MDEKLKELCAGFAKALLKAKKKLMKKKKHLRRIRFSTLHAPLLQKARKEATIYLFNSYGDRLYFQKGLRLFTNQRRPKTMYQDETLKCEDCGQEFVFTVGEQEFYAEKGLVNKPKRCPECRKDRRQRNSRKKMYEAVCSECGAQTKVPFKPIEGKEIYCKECYLKRQATV